MPRRMCLLGVIAAAAVPGANAAPASFGHNGLVTVQDSRFAAYPSAVAVAPDGNVLVAGNDGFGPKVFRFTAAGRRIGFGPKAAPRLLRTSASCDPAMLVRPDGTMVVVCGNLVAWLRPDATLDWVHHLGDVHLEAVTVDGKGRTIAAGGVLLRLLPDGRLDRTFGHDGEVALPSGGRGVVIAGGRIVVASGGKLVGYRDDGSLDPSFGAQGYATIGGFIASSVVVERDGRIVAGGSHGDDAAVVRFLPDGTPDPSFGSGGLASWHPDSPSVAEAVAVRRNGALDVAVLGWNPATAPYIYPGKQWLVARVTAHGHVWRQAGGPDELIDPTDECLEEVPFAVAEQPDGKTLVSGVACPDRVDADTYSLVMRYTAGLERDGG